MPPVLFFVQACMQPWHKAHWLWAAAAAPQVRASALLRFPRQLPLDPEDPDAFKLQVQRLTLKSRW